MVSSDAIDLEPISDEVALGEAEPQLQLEQLDPRFRRLVEYALSNIDLSVVPPLFRGIVSGAVGTLVNKLASDPDGSRDSIIDLVERAVKDLRIARDELTCWDADGDPVDD